MKGLKTSTMRRLLNKGKRKARGCKAPPDGVMQSLFTETLPNGWYYRVDYVRDSRMFAKPYVAVYAFRPPVSGCARTADYCLMEELQ